MLMKLTTGYLPFVVLQQSAGISFSNQFFDTFPKSKTSLEKIFFAKASSIGYLMGVHGSSRGPWRGSRVVIPNLFFVLGNLS